MDASILESHKRTGQVEEGAAGAQRGNQMLPSKLGQLC